MEERKDPEAMGPEGDEVEVTRIPEASAEVAALKAAVAEAEGRLMRLMADFDNLRRRSAERELALREQATADTVLFLLPVRDDLERALQAPDDAQALKQGVALTLASFQATLERMGVKPVEAEGEIFNPRIHEALTWEERTDVPEDTVTQVLLPGYRLGEKLLRPALVKVAKAPDGDA